MEASEYDFNYVFQPGEGATLLLLHGTGGNEHDLLPLGRAIAPGAAILSPRGKVLEHGAPRYFRRLAEGVFDMEDLHFRTAELARFIDSARRKHAVSELPLVAVGFSNGANIAGSLLLSHPGLLAGAIQLRPMTPFEPDEPVDLSGTRVLISAGTLDPLVPVVETERWVGILRDAGAEVELHWHQGGHGLAQDDLEIARRWFHSQEW